MVSLDRRTNAGAMLARFDRMRHPRRDRAGRRGSGHARPATGAGEGPVDRRVGRDAGARQPRPRMTRQRIIRGREVAAALHDVDLKSLSLSLVR